MLRKPKLVLIDLDGTLVDSVPDLAFAADRTMEELGRPPRGAARVRDWVGNGVERLVKRVLTSELYAEPEAAEYAAAYPIFCKHYEASNGKYSCLFPGVAEGLHALAEAGYALGCVTNKAEAFTLPLLKALGIYERFGIVVSGDTTPFKKPRPEPLLMAAKHFGVAPEDALMVGDSMHDVEAARNAGFQVVCVTYGYNHGVDIREAKPDAVIENMMELPGLFAASRN